MFGLVACSSSPDSRHESGGGTLRIGFSGAILEGVNPFTTFSFDAKALFTQVYPSLVQLTGDLKFTPNLASKWAVSDDGLTWTFDLASGGQWSDGKPITAADAAYTINTIRKYADSALSGTTQASTVAGVTSAVAKDDHTLVVTYKVPSGTVLWTLARLNILPEHVWSQHEGNGGKDLTAFSNYPTVSGGPFVLTEFQKGDHVLAKRNAHYYRDEPSIAGFGLVTFKNTDALIQAAKNGQVDLAVNLPATAVAAFSGAAGVKLAEGPGAVMDTLYVNVNQKRPEHRELLDKAVREAMDLALSRKEIVDTVWLGHAEAGSSFVPPSAGEWNDSSITPPEQDLAAANAKLDAAGYPRGADGIRSADGHRMSYQLITTTDNDAADREFKTMQKNFHDVGIEVKQASMDPNTASQAVTAPDGKATEYQLILWYAFGAIDFNFYSSLFLCSGIGSTNGDSYCNPEYDRIYKEANLTVDDSQRKQLEYQLQQLVFRDKPEFELDYRNIIEARSSGWDGFVMGPQGSFSSLNSTTLEQVHQAGD